MKKKNRFCVKDKAKTVPRNFVHILPSILSRVFWTPAFRRDMNLITDHKYKIKEWELMKQHMGTTWELYK